MLCVAGRVKDTHTDTNTHTLIQSAQQIKIQRQRQKQGQAKEDGARVAREGECGRGHHGRQVPAT